MLSQWLSYLLRTLYKKHILGDLKFTGPLQQREVSRLTDYYFSELASVDGHASAAAAILCITFSLWPCALMMVPTSKIYIFNFSKCVIYTYICVCLCLCLTLKILYF
jgi:hypothetical protein